MISDELGKNIFSYDVFPVIPEPDTNFLILNRTAYFFIMELNYLYNIDSFSVPYDTSKMYEF